VVVCICDGPIIDYYVVAFGYFIVCLACASLRFALPPVVDVDQFFTTAASWTDHGVGLYYYSLSITRGARHSSAGSGRMAFLIHYSSIPFALLVVRYVLDVVALLNCARYAGWWD